MDEKDNLLSLVKSLTKEEVTFIEKFSELRRKKPKKALALLADMLQKKTSITSLRSTYKSLNVTRFQLKQLILQALRALDKEPTIAQKITNHLHNENIYYRKGIYEEAAKELRSAEELAKCNQEYGHLIQILICKQHRTIESLTKDLVPTIDSNAERLLEALERYAAELNEMINYQQVFARYRSKDQQPLDQVELPSSSASPPPTFTNELYANLKASLIARSRGEFLKAGEYLGKAIQAYEKYPELIESQTNRYKILLANFATFLIPTKEFDLVESMLEKLVLIPDKDFNGEAETFQSHSHLRLLLALNKVDFTGFPKLVQEIETGMETFQGKINQARQFSIWFNLMAAYFVQEDFSKALTWLDKIILNKRHRIREEIQYATRVIELALHFEHANFLGIPSKIIALKRYLERKTDKTPFKMAVLTSFQELSKSPNERETFPIFLKLESELDSIRHSGENLDRLGLLLLQSWAKARFSGTSIADALRLLQ